MNPHSNNYTTPIILVNWKRSLDTCKCVESLQRMTQKNWRVIICENGSKDNSSNDLRKFLTTHYLEVARTQKQNSNECFDYFLAGESSPKVTIVVSEKNLGFAGGNNIAFNQLKNENNFKFVWFLNNDTEVDPESLKNMQRHMESSEKIGICGSTLIYAQDGKTVQALGGAAYKTWTGGVREIGNGLTWPCTVDQAAVEAQMSYVSGASMLVSAAFLDKVGLMSEDYFLYYEEIDWATRARRAGFKLGYASDAVVFHKEGAALGSGKSQQRSALAEYYGVRNRIVFTRKFFPWALPSAYLFSWMQVAKRLLQGHGKRARMMAAVLLGLRRTPPVGR